MKKAINMLKKSEIYINDTPGISIFKIGEILRKIKIKNNIKFVVINYLQLISYDREKNLNRGQEISIISLELKKLAKELDITILVTSQLSRRLESRKNHRPVLEDFSNSRSIIRDADVVMLLYKDKDILEVNVAKNRYGECKTINLKTKHKTILKSPLTKGKSEKLINDMGV